MTGVVTPHDHFFRGMLQHKETAKEFFQSHLPANIRKEINLDSIKLESDTFIESNLRSQATDLLYSAQFSERLGYLYLHVEHQSTPDKFMPFRLLKYVVAIMDRHLKQNKGDILPVVYPMVVYSGKEPYNCSRDIFDLFGSNKELAIDTLFKPHQLLDFNKIDDNKIKQYIYHGVIIKTMQRIHDHDIISALEKEIIPILQPLINLLGKNYVNTVVHYVIEAGEISNEEKLIEIINHGLSKNFGEEAMTFANRLRQEGEQVGIEKGMQKGMQQGKYQASVSFVKYLLSEGKNIREIEQITGLSSSEIGKIKREQ